MTLEKLRKYLLWGLFVTGTIILIIIGFILYQYLGTGQVTINILPADANYNLGGKNYVGNISKLKLPAGSYQVTFSRAGFVKKTENIKIEGNKEKILDILLTPVSEQAVFGSLSHDDQIQYVYNEQAEQQRLEFAKKNPLVANLPYSSSGFSIDYDASKTPVVILVSLYPDKQNPEGTVKKTVIAWIKSQSVDPTKLTIQYTIIPPATDE